jgi:hypothetical protein
LLGAVRDFSAVEEEGDGEEEGGSGGGFREGVGDEEDGSGGVLEGVAVGRGKGVEERVAMRQCRAKVKGNARGSWF